MGKISLKRRKKNMISEELKTIVSTLQKKRRQKMNQYTEEQIQNTLKNIESSIVNCEKIRPKLKVGSSSFSLNTNRIKALYISKALLKNQNNDYTNEEIENAVLQIASIRSKSITGINNTKEGSATYTRFSRLIKAMDIVLDYLQKAIDECE